MTRDQLGPLPEFIDRDKTDPVVRVSALAGDDVWLVTGYALGRQVLGDARFSRAAATAPDAPKLNTANPAATSVMSMDGADHRRLRRLVSDAFSPRRIDALRPRVGRLVDEFLDAMAAAGPPVDLIESFAAPLPLTVASALLGVPDSDRDTIRGLAGVLFDMTASSPMDKARRGFELFAYMTRLLERKRREPGDDVCSDIARSRAAGLLSQPEHVDLALALLTAGYETTVGQIGLSVWASLMAHEAGHTASLDAGTPSAAAARPDTATFSDMVAAQAAVAASGAGACPRASVRPEAADELLRLTPATPVSFPRVATEDVELGGVTIRAGQAVVVSLLHGNRDGDVFPDPDRVATGRAKHLAFGHGPHYCLGAPLARMQLDLALSGLAERFPGLRPAAGPDSIAWHDGFVTRGLSRLLVTW